MTIWVRNFRSVYASDDAFGLHSLAFYLRELLFVARYTEHSKSGTGWTENLISSPTDCIVQESSPRIIYSPSGPFSASMVDDCVISLLATNDQNRSIWRIRSYIDSQHIEVDSVGCHPDGWTDEIGIVARISKVDTGFSTTADCYLDTPVSECRVKIAKTVDQLSCSIHPTAQLGDVTPYTDSVVFDGVGEHQRIFHMFAEGGDVVLYWNSETYQEFLQISQLLDVDTGDNYPWVIFGKKRFSAESQEYAWHIPGFCVDSAKNPIDAYITWVQAGWNAEDTNSPGTRFGRRTVNGVPGYAPLRSPWIALEDRASTGSCVRGRLPHVYVTNAGYEPLRPLEASGELLHWYGGLVVPRNGEFDPTPIGLSLLVYNPGNVYTSVFHQDISGEIVGLPSKPAPVPDDWLLIEDSEDDDEKKGVQIKNLPISSFRDVELVTGKLVVQPEVGIEEVCGGRAFDGADVGIQTVRFVSMWVSSLPSGTSYVRLYDIGPKAGPPSTSVLIAEFSVTTSGTQVDELALSVSASGPSLGVIKDTARMYEVRVASTAPESSTTFIHNAYFTVGD